MSQYREITNKYLIAFQEGNKDEFANFYDDMKGTFARYAMRYLYDKSLWRDVLSETYIRISNSIASFNRLGNGYSWILKIIENAAKDINTKESKYVAVETLENLYVAEDFDPYSEIDATIDLEYMLKDLDKSYLEVALLHFRGGRTQSEIAKMMDVSRSAVCQKIKKIKDVVKNKKTNT